MPALPAINISRVLMLQGQIQLKLELKYFACVLEGPAFHDMVDELNEILKVDRSTLSDSVKHLAGTTITDAHVDEVSWRLAGNMRKLKSHVAVSPWAYQPKAEWVPVQVRGVYPAAKTVRAKDAAGKKTNEKITKKGYRFRFLVLAGSPAGRRFDQFLSYAYVRRIRLEAGFSKFDKEKYSFNVAKNPSYPLRDAREFTQARLFVKLAATLPHEDMAFTDVRGTSGCRVWNLGLFKKRLRRTFPCPMAYDVRKVPCRDCQVGYDRCEAACHPRTYTAGPCEKCGRKTWFDQGACVSCANKH